MLKATLIGNLGNAPDLRYSANGSPLLRFNVASNYRARTPEGEYQDKTEFVRVTVLGQRAESLSQYLRKATKVCVFGKLEARPWTAQDGSIRAGLEILADDIEFVSSRAAQFSVDDLPARSSAAEEQVPRVSVADERRDRRPMPE